MPRTCLTCGHRRRDAIDEAIVAGESNRNIANRFGMSAAAVFRHRQHVPEQLSRAHEASRVASADRLLDRLDALGRRAERLVATAESRGRLREAAPLLREARENVRALVEVAAELKKGAIETGDVIDDATATRVAEVWLRRHPRTAVIEPRKEPETPPQLPPSSGGTWRI